MVVIFFNKILTKKTSWNILVCPSNPIVMPRRNHVRNVEQNKLLNDLFVFTANCWTQEDVPEPRPQARYGQSQLFLDDRHLLILGGSGGPSNTFNDVWVLSMEPGAWRWIECTVKNADKFGALHMWCHPACK